MDQDARSGKREVLLVEDDADTRELLMYVLAPEIELASAPDLKSARALIAGRQFDLFILDTRLPDGSAIDLLTEIRRHTASTPVIFVSADARPAVRQEALNSGAQAYMIKPVDIDVLRQTVLRLLPSFDLLRATRRRKLLQKSAQEA